MSITTQPTAMSYFAAIAAFNDGTDSPRAFLERCLETIAARESDIGAFVATNPDAAREAADAASERWKSGSADEIEGGNPHVVEEYGVLDPRPRA